MRYPGRDCLQAASHATDLELRKESRRREHKEMLISYRSEGHHGGSVYKVKRENPESQQLRDCHTKIVENLWPEK